MPRSPHGDRYRPTFDASTSGWDLETWAYEADILRATQSAIIARRAEKEATLDERVDDDKEQGGNDD